MYCKNCGSEAGEGVKFCPNCGGVLENAVNNAQPAADAYSAPVTNTYSAPVQPVPQAQQTYGGGYAQQPSYGQPSYSQPAFDPQAAAGSGAATGSMILGIVGLVLNCTFYLSGISLILAIIGLAKSSKAKKLGYNGGKRKAGFGLSLASLIISIVEFCILAFIIIAFLVSAYVGNASKAQRQVQQYQEEHNKEITKIIEDIDSLG